MTISKLQQAVQYNKAHLPRTAAGLAALQPDVSTDSEFKHRLRCELADLLQQLDSCTHRIYSGASSNALFELATENWAKLQLRPNWSVIAYRLGPDLWLIPMAENKIAFWATRQEYLDTGLLNQAEPSVRCKNCKFSYADEHGRTCEGYWFELSEFAVVVQDDDFCSRGEARPQPI